MTTPTALLTTVTPSFPVITYCDPSDILKRVSVEALNLRIEDFGNDTIGGTSGAVEDCIWEATDICNMYLYLHYWPQDIVKSQWVRGRATDLAVYFLCIRRLNTPPSSAEFRYRESISWLEKVHAGIIDLPGIPVRHTHAPAWSNVRVDQRYSTFRLRNERLLGDSSGRPYPSPTDWASEFDYMV